MRGTLRSGSDRGRVRRVEALLHRLVLLVPPLVLAVLASVHPTEHNHHDSVAALAPVAGEWVRIHLLLLPSMALVAVGLYSLVAARHSGAALAARVGIALYAFGAIVVDAVNGLAVGIVLTELESQPGVDAATVEPALNGLFGGPMLALAGLVAIAGYLVAVVAAAVVLSRDGAPLPPLILLVGSVLGVVSHVGPRGVAGWLLFFAAAVWLTVGWSPDDPAVGTRSASDA